MKHHWRKIYNSKDMVEWRAILPNGSRVRVYKFKGRKRGGLGYIFNNKETGFTKHVSLSRDAAIAFARKTLSVLRA